MKYAAYENYKSTASDWLGNVPSHWQVDRLKWSTTGSYNGVWGDEPNEIDDLICVRVADFDRERFVVVDNPPTMRAIEPSQRRNRLLQKNDLLIEKSGGGEKQLVGCVVQFTADVPAVSSNFVARLPVASGCDSRFLTYAHAAIYAGKLNYPSIKQTTGIQNLDSGEYLNILAPYPPFEEQQTIARFLDAKTAQIDDLIAKKRQLIDKLKEKRSALIARTVTRGLPPEAAKAAGLEPHPEMKDSGVEWLGEIPVHWTTPPLYVRYSVELGKMLSETKITGKYLTPYLRNIDVQWSLINYQYLPEMDISPAEYSRYTIRTGDLLVCEGGEVGRAAIVGKFDGVIGYQKALHRLRALSENEDQGFMYFVLEWAAQTGVFNAEGTSTIAHLTGEQLRKYRFPKPQIIEQKLIAKYLLRETENIGYLQRKVEAAITRLTEYRQAIITSAVIGKIDVRETPTLPEAA